MLGEGDLLSRLSPPGSQPGLTCLNFQRRTKKIAKWVCRLFFSGHLVVAGVHGKQTGQLTHTHTHTHTRTSCLNPFSQPFSPHPCPHPSHPRSLHRLEVDVITLRGAPRVGVVRVQTPGPVCVNLLADPIGDTSTWSFRSETFGDGDWGGVFGCGQAALCGFSMLVVFSPGLGSGG